VSPVPAPDRIPPITNDYLIVGEGQGDSAFVKNLCDVRGVDLSNFQIEEAGGTGKFESYIGGLKLRPHFDRVKGLLIVGDNDDSPDENFGNIQNHLKKGKLPRPTQRLQVARHAADSVAVAVMMLPYTIAGGATRGSLETLLLKSVNDSYPVIGACVDAYRRCIPPGGRTNNEEDKFRLRCFLAALWVHEPNISLQYAVSPSKHLINLNHECFNEVAAFLGEFVRMCAPPART